MRDASRIMAEGRRPARLAVIGVSVRWLGVVVVGSVKINGPRDRASLL